MKLAARGYTRVMNLDGAIFEWATRGYPLYAGDERVTQVHPYDGTWGRLLDPSLRAPLD